MRFALKIALILAAFVSVDSYAKTKHHGKGISDVQCLANVMAGESDGTEAGMISVGGVVMKRVRDGAGSICSVSRAPGQFVGYRLAAGKAASTRALALKTAQYVISHRVVGKYSNFRTAGMTSCGGHTIHGNTFFNGDCNGRAKRYAKLRGHSNRQYASNKRRHQDAVAQNRRPARRQAVAQNVRRRHAVAENIPLPVHRDAEKLVQTAELEPRFEPAFYSDADLNGGEATR